MKTIIFIIVLIVVLIALPVSLRAQGGKVIGIWADDDSTAGRILQEYLDKYDTVNAVVRAVTDTSYDWQASYYKQKHRADSLKNIVDKMKDVIWEWDAFMIWHDSVTALNKRLAGCVFDDAFHHADSVFKNTWHYWFDSSDYWRDKYNALRDSVEKNQMVCLWQGYWRIDTTVKSIGRYYNDEWEYKEDTSWNIDTTWRPIAPVKKGGE